MKAATREQVSVRAENLSFGYQSKQLLWKDVSFDKLRAIGAFVVSASLENGDVSLVKVVSEKGGLLRLVNPFKGKFRIAGKKKKITEKNGVLELKTRAGEEITLERIGL